MILEVENILKKIFLRSNPNLCHWDNLQYASVKGKLKTNFVYSLKTFKSVIPNGQNIAFLKGNIYIKNIIALIWIAFYLISSKDFFFFLVIPSCLLTSHVIEFMWYKRLATTVIVNIILFVSGYYLGLNSNYYWFIIFYTTLSSFNHQVHNDFLSELFYSEPAKFLTGIKTKYITAIYDTLKNKKYEGPFDSEIYFEVEEYQAKGVDILSEIVEHDIGNSVTYFNRGLAKAPFDCEGAIDDFTKAIEIDPEYKEAYKYRGLAKKKLGIDGSQDLLKAGYSSAGE